MKRLGILFTIVLAQVVFGTLLTSCRETPISERVFSFFIVRIGSSPTDYNLSVYSLPNNGTLTLTSGQRAAFTITRDGTNFAVEYPYLYTQNPNIIIRNGRINVYPFGSGFYHYFSAIETFTETEAEVTLRGKNVEGDIARFKIVVKSAPPRRN